MKMASFIANCINYGPIYAVAVDRIMSEVPLDPKSNWDFWTTERNPFLEKLLRAYPFEHRRRILIDRNLWRMNKKGIELHYDVSNDFFACFLDTEFRFYTAARFLSETETLEDAQRNKAKFMLDLLDPRPWHEIRDAGCGWGGTIACIAERTGTHKGLIGYTLSQQQYQFVLDLGYNVQLKDFVKMQYKAKSIDRFISIGSLEHVRPNELPEFYRKIYSALKPQGRMVNQFFSLNHHSLPPSMLWSQLFFPGSTLAMHKAHLLAAKEAGFKIEVDEKGCYKQTLRAWYDNLVANQAKAIQARDLTAYNHFLTFFPMAWRFFHDGDATLHRMLLTKK